MSTIKVENEKLKNELKEYKDKAEKAEEEKKKSEISAFLDSMVKEGRMRPADKEFHASQMQEKKEEDLKKYMDFLKNQPKIVDVSGEHVANNETAGSDENALDKRAKEIMKEEDCLYSVALKKAYNENPEAYKLD